MLGKAGKFQNFLIRLLSSGFYSGYSPVMPGTAGTCVGVLIYRFLMPKNSYFYLTAIFILVILGIWISTKAEIIYNKKDDQHIVIDEIIGYLVSMVLLPYNVKIMITGFVIFRIFDWVKPYPIKKLENLNSGIGIIADDVMAGVYTCMCLHLVGRLVSW